MVILFCVLFLRVIWGIKLTVKCLYPTSELEEGDVFTIRGDQFGLNWKQGEELMQTSTNLWEIELSGNSVDKFEFKIMVNDEVWQIGHNEIIQFSSTMNSGDYEVNVYPFFKTAKGTYERIDYIFSPQLNNTRDISIYLPPSFYENTYKPVKYVLVMHDGNNLFDPKTAPSWSQPWYCQDTLNALIYEGTIPEVMIIGPWNTIDRLDEYTYSYDKEEKGGGKGDLYLDFLEETCIPRVVKWYGSGRIQIERDNLGILGSSLGGLISCYAGWKRSDKYKRIGCMSSSFWWNNEDFINDVIKKDKLPQEDTLFYLDTGTINDCYNSTIDVKAVLDGMKQFVKNKNYFFYLDKGATHNEYYWGKRFHVPISDLFPVEPIIL